MGPLRKSSDLSLRSQNLIDLSSDLVLTLQHTSNRQVVDSYLPDSTFSTLGPSSTSRLLWSTFMTGCLRTILKKLEQYMAKWDIVRCADNHFHWVIYGIGLYITDYPEQVLVVGIVNSWCPAYLNSLLVRLVCLQNYGCDGPSMNLNTTNAALRTREKAERLFETKSNDKLWFDHGLIGDLHIHLPYVSAAQFG